MALKKISIFGISLGTLLGLIIANAVKDVEKLVLNAPGFSVAESMWQWDSVIPEFKAQLTRRYKSLENFRKTVHAIEPINHMDNLAQKDLLVFISDRDEILPSEPTAVKEELSKRKCRYNLIVNHKYGHILTCLTNLVNVPVYLRFLTN